MLQGSIGRDGAVSELRILKGANEITDRAALDAFARWKFKPALMAGTPVALEILVGIPAIAPGN